MGSGSVDESDPDKFEFITQTLSDNTKDQNVFSTSAESSEGEFEERKFATTEEESWPDQSCQIRRIGTPVQEQYDGYPHGWWMPDVTLPTYDIHTKYWVAKHFERKELNEYNSMKDLNDDKLGKVIRLQYSYFGTGHIIYNGSFYYQESGHPNIIKYDLTTQTYLMREMQNMAYMNELHLFKTKYIYFKFAADENALWLIYSNENSENVLVSQIDPYNLDILNTRTLDIRRGTFDSGFIACGILYLIKDSHSIRSKIDLGYNLYSREMSTVDISMKNPYSFNAMVSYHPINRRLYTWDNGRLLWYLTTTD